MTTLLVFSDEVEAHAQARALSMHQHVVLTELNGGVQIKSPGVSNEFVNGAWAVLVSDNELLPPD